MQNEKIFQSHILFNGESAVNEIAEPFLSENNLSYFAIQRVYTDGSHSGLSSIKNLTRDYYENQFYNSMEFIALRKQINKTTYLLWDRTSQSDLEVVNFVKEKYALGDGLTVFIPGDGYTDAYDFATHYNNTNMVPYFINETDAILTFIEHFTCQALPLLQEADNTKFVVPNYKPKEISDYYQPLIHSRNSSRRMVNTEASLSQRQQEILHYLAHGLSAKDIANKLNLKVKTIYYYTELIKRKLRLYNRNQLIKYYWKCHNQTKLV